MQFPRPMFAATLGLVIAASSAFAQEKRGIWEGTAYTGNGNQVLTVVIDSAAGGWKGSVISAQLGDSVQLVEVGVAADTLSFGIPFQGMVVYVSGLIAADKFSGGIWVQNQSAGTIELTRKKPAAAAPKPPEESELLADRPRR